MIYPNDDNGDALRRMKAEGDNLTKSRDVDFTVVFPNERSAKTFAEHFQRNGYASTVDFAETVAELPWDVVVVRNMTPTHEGISNFEAELQEIANPLGGRNDGWGCFSEPEGSPVQ